MRLFGKKKRKIKGNTAVEWDNKGTALAESGRHNEAIKCYDRALEIDPEFVLAWCNKGVAFAESGRHDKAMRCYDVALEIDPDFGLAWGAKGHALLGLGRFDEAIRYCDRALEIVQSPIGRFYNLTLVGSLGRLGRYDAWVEGTKGCALCVLGRFDEAIRCCDRALEINPENALLWLGKGNALDRSGRYDEAITCYDRALEIGTDLELLEIAKKAKIIASLKVIEEKRREEPKRDEREHKTHKKSAGSTKDDTRPYYYKVLDVSTDASQDELKKAYRRLSMLYHPDASTDPDAEKKMKEINKAYDVLSYPDKRARYDNFENTFKG